MDSKTGGEKTEAKRERKTVKWTTRECLQGQERQKRCLHLLIHAQRTCLCLGALGDVLKAVVMNAFLSPVASFISGRLSACSHCRRKLGRTSSLFTVVATLKTSSIRNEFVGRQRKFGIPEERKEQNLGGRLKNCLQAFLVKF